MFKPNSGISAKDKATIISLLELIVRSPHSEQQILTIFADDDDPADQKAIHAGIKHLKAKKLIGYKSYNHKLSYKVQPLEYIAINDERPPNAHPTVQRGLYDLSEQRRRVAV